MLIGNAAQVMQTHFRRLIQRRNFLKMRNAVSFLQIAIRAWLEVKFNSTLEDFDTSKDGRLSFFGVLLYATELIN